MSKKKNSKINKTIKVLIFSILKPFLPFIIILVFLLGTTSTILNAIYIQFVQEDDDLLSNDELQLKKMCEIKADELNKINNTVDGNSIKELLDVNNREYDKLLQWSHLYSIITFHNMANDEKLTKELLDKVGNSFKSNFKYISDSVRTEKKVKDEKDKEKWELESVETQYLLVESNSIIGHFTYTYKDFEEINGDTKIKKKVFVSENLIGDNYEMLSNYLKNTFKVKDEDIEEQIEIVIQSATGYYNNSENTSWLFNKETSVKKGNNNSNGNVDIQIDNNMFTWPIPGYNTVTSEFGYRVHPITKVYKLHTGTDIGAPEGANFVAMADGVVITAGTNTAYGKMVMISHGNGIVTLYAHGSKLLVKTNQTVTKGQAVLKVGSTGYSTGPHAHFEVRINNQYVNPMQFFEGGS